jgi:hypothetical protein
MKNIPKYLVFSMAIAALFLTSCEKQESVNAVDTELTGTWKLDAIVYGLSQHRVQGDSLPYTETLSFAANGAYTISRDGKQTETGESYTGKNTSGLAADRAIFYKKDTTYQTYVITEGRLFLYQRADQGSVIADGSTYEYVRVGTL